jgi:hypothetical protein
VGAGVKVSPCDVFSNFQTLVYRPFRIKRTRVNLLRHYAVVSRTGFLVADISKSKQSPLRVLAGQRSWNCQPEAGFVLSVEQARKIDPSLNDLFDEELQAVLDEQYELGQLAYECWQRKI